MDIWPSVSTPEIALVAAAAMIAGVIRGFSGFGSALVVVPVMAAVFGPRLAVPAGIIVHIITSIQLTPRALRDCEWGRVVPLSITGCLAIPVGAWVLATQDPTLLRRAISVLIVVFAIMLLRGWRYTGKVNGWITATVGAVGGFITGAATIGGPPVVAFLMAGPYTAAQNRAAIILYFIFVQMMAVAMYWVAGLFEWPVVGICIIVTPTLAVGTLIGQALFNQASEQLFRRIALGFLMVIGVATFFL